jgi:hypothetical protein
MSYEKIERTHWKDFCDAVSHAIEGRLATLEIVGSDVGVQIEGEKLSLDGISYDPHDETLYLTFQSDVRDAFEHAIASPRELYVELGEEGVSRVIITESNGRKQFLHLSHPLQLPAATSAA